MKDFPRMDPDDLNFPLDRIVRTRILLAKGNTRPPGGWRGSRHDAYRGSNLSRSASPCRRVLPENGRSVESEKRIGPAESDRIMDESIDYAAVSQAVRQELCLLFRKLLGEEGTRQC